MKKKMSKSLVLANAGKHLTQYQGMCKAIAICHNFDECKDIIDKSVAMAAYYKQIKDTETQIMFYRVRLRAWRRIGELFSVVSFKDCETQTAKVKKVRATFVNDPTVKDMSDSRILEVLKLMDVTDDDFEIAINQEVGGSIADLLTRTPAYREQLKKQEEYWEKERAKQQREVAQNARVYAENTRKHDEQERLKAEHSEELHESAEAAMKEVGITLELIERANMRRVVFLIKDEVHSVMRQAAFDKHITMQEVLRRGLKLWLEANGYDWPEYDPPKRSKYATSRADVMVP